MKRVPRSGERVEAPEPLLTHFHEPRSPEVSKVARGLRLRDPENVHDVADAELPTEEEVEDPDPRAIGTRPEHRGRTVT